MDNMTMKQPDIIVFMSDQHSHLFHRSFGGIVETPHFDALAQGGTIFNQAYTSCPLCVPARMSLLSGRLPSDTGILTNSDTLPDTTPTFLHAMVKAGYETVLIGRMHFIGMDQRHGFTKRLFGDITPVTWNRPIDEMKKERGIFMFTFSEPNCTDVAGGGESPVIHYDCAVVDAALEYLHKEHEKPQCIVVGTYGPHFPYVAPVELYQKYRDMVKLPLFFEEVPSYFDEFMKKRQRHESKEKALQCLAAYCGMVEQTDHYIGILREAAGSFERKRKNGLVFAYLSDHGDQAGERKYYGKQTFFEKSVKIPLVMEGCGIPAGLKIDTPVSIMDMGPTFCGFSSAVPPPRQAGIDLRSLFANPASGSERAVLSETLYENDGAYQLHRMVRLNNFKYISSGENSDMLFDLCNDPEEKTNVINDYPDAVKQCVQILSGLKPKQEVENGQIQRTQEVDLLRVWEQAAESVSNERWRGNPLSARDYPKIF
ncbi:MAG: sulfatase-like hydrolase/transferase [Treponema sp.]|nr:sulfatase-like hydrolase/transferase [Treponema sp.]